MERAAKGVELLAWLHDVGEAEVGDFDIQLAVEKQVFRFEVTMNNQEGVAVLHGGDDLGG